MNTDIDYSDALENVTRRLIATVQRLQFATVDTSLVTLMFHEKQCSFDVSSHHRVHTKA